MEADLGIGGGHGCLECARPVQGLRGSLIQASSLPDRAVALDDAEPLGMIDAGDQVDDVHPGVVHAAQDRAHAGQRPLVAAHIERDGIKPQQADDAISRISHSTFSFDQPVP